MARQPAPEVVPLRPVSSFSPLLTLQDFQDGYSHSMNVINIIPLCGAKRPLTRYSRKLVSEMTPDSVNLTTLARTMSLDLNNINKKSLSHAFLYHEHIFKLNKLSTAAIQAHPILYHIVIVTPNTILK